MDKNKTLILVEEDSSNIFNEFYEKNAYHYECFFKRISKPLRALRRLWIKHLPYKRVFFSDWYKNINNYDCLIINVNKLTRYAIEEVSIMYPDKRIIGWYWNTIDQENKPIIFKDNIEYYSFDKGDCDKYNLKYNIQYYHLDEKILKEKSIDVYFIGRNKGRKSDIDNLKTTLSALGLNCDFTIIENEKSIISYEKVKEKIASSRAILEINKENQEGLTLRALESVFFEVKLITNNQGIINLPIYNKNNIFVLGLDNDIREFLNKEYDHSVDTLKKQLSVDAWFNNFD